MMKLKGYTENLEKKHRTLKTSVAKILRNPNSQCSGD